MPGPCSVCSASDSKYICPRCNAPYCSLDCYKKHSNQCVETFQRESAAEELRTHTATEEDKQRMEEILWRLHRQQIEDAEASSASAGEDEDAGQLIGGLSIERALQLAEGEITADDLTAEELAAVESAVAAEAIQVEPWHPWWLKDAAAQLGLAPTGTSLVQVVGDPSDTQRGNVGGEEEEESSALPPPPALALPQLAVLTSKTPSPALPLHLLDLLFSYCLVMRVFNGQYSTDALDAAATVLEASAVLGATRQPAGAESTVPAALVDCVAHACGPSAGRGKVPPGFSIGLISDVAALLQLGAAVIVTALNDLSRLLDAGAAELRSAASSGKQQQQQRSKELTTKVKQAQRKLLYFMAWANEAPHELYSMLAAQAAACYQQQRESVVAEKKEDAGVVYKE